uniref:Uncharacterized protein n=1 Tax=Physcomitrium patens TaxID=3218 RepID=A0A2K1IY20_PHYPA|nr:hypothetical protein PHYPA_023983 [Physcomitrium patens]
MQINVRGEFKSSYGRTHCKQTSSSREKWSVSEQIYAEAKSEIGQQAIG